MPQAKLNEWTAEDYDRAAQDYCRRLPLEHFMEAICQSTQRKIVLESLDLLARQRADVEVFSELLVQYMRRGRLHRVVPDIMLRRQRQPLTVRSSYNIELDKVPLFFVMEIVAAASRRKDYGTNFQKYERELKVPYCLLFYPEMQDLQLHRLEGKHYERVPANAEGRYAIPELELEVAILDGWVRFWYQGKLLPLPAEMQDELEQEKQRAEQERQRAEQAETELARLRQQLVQLQASRANGGGGQQEK